MRQHGDRMDAAPELPTPHASRGDAAMRWRGYRFHGSFLRELAGLLAAGAALSAAWPQSVRADEAALEEVTVTAQRVSERLQDVPVAVTAIPASELLDRGLRQAGAITPSVSHLPLNFPNAAGVPATATRRVMTA